VLYGKIEKVTQTNPPSYRVSLKLLNVNRKQLVSSTVETLPLAGATGTGPSTYAKAWYAKLVGINTGGTVIVKANLDRGTVMLDEEAKGNLASGTLTLSNVPEGRHTLAIEAKDYQRYEASITVRNGETLPHNATLSEMSKKTAKTPKTPKPPPTGEPSSKEATVATTSGSNVWKPVFYGTAIAEAGAIGFTILEWRLATSHAPPGTNDSMCKDSIPAGLGRSCSENTFNQIGFGVSIAVGAAVVGSFYMAFIRDRGHSETQTANGGHRKRRELAITPVITPDGGGATLRFDW